jgi:hypothetical protein
MPHVEQPAAVGEPNRWVTLRARRVLGWHRDNELDGSHPSQ